MCQMRLTVTVQNPCVLIHHILKHSKESAKSSTNDGEEFKCQVAPFAAISSSISMFFFECV